MKLYSRKQYDSEAQRKNPICPFCKENIEESYVVWKGKYLFVQHNKYPFGVRDDHFLVIPHRHITLTSEMSQEEFLELRDVELWMKQLYKEKSYFSFIREQSPEKSVAHLHYHFCSGDVSSEVLDEHLKII